MMNLRLTEMKSLAQGFIFHHVDFVLFLPTHTRSAGTENCSLGLSVFSYGVAQAEKPN